MWMIANRRPFVLGDRQLLPGTIMDLFSLAVIFWIGRIRGWSFASFGWRVSWKGTGAGVVLFIVVAIVQVSVDILANAVHPEGSGFVITGLTVPAIFILSVINPFFEEVLEAGYLIYSLQRFGMWPAILAGSLFRAFLHSWQGLNGAFSIFALGMILGFAYWRWRQLWPLIVAHSLCDFLGLLYLTHHAV